MAKDNRGRPPRPHTPVLLATSTTSDAPLLPSEDASPPTSGPGRQADGANHGGGSGTAAADRFRWEADMTSPVVTQVHRLHPRSRVAHLTVGEVPAAVGVVDVVVASFHTDALRHRLDSGIGPICSPLKMRTLDILSDRRRHRVTTVARKVGSNGPALLRSTLGPLAELGAVTLDGPIVRSTGAWCPVAAQLTAVELKLTKWRDALRQADNFAISADRSWVVLDAARAKAAVAAADTFGSWGVGLAVLDRENRLRVVVRPAAHRRPDRWLKNLMAERTWAVAEGEVAEIARTDLDQLAPPV